MLNATEPDAQAPQRPSGQPHLNEPMLRAEIGFWKELIESCDASQPPDSIERMHQALALAESRLAALFQARKEDCQDGNAHSGNVFYLERARRIRK